MKPLLTGFATLSAGDCGRNPLTVADLVGNVGWTNPNIGGVRLRLSHKVICPTQTTRNWTLLDTAVQQARKYNKRLRLSVVAGYSTADWVYAQGVTKYQSANGAGSQPLPWDAQWQAIWFAFIDELAAHVPPYLAPVSTKLSLEKDPLIACVVPCGFSTEAGMYFGDTNDEARMPHIGYSTVHIAYQTGTKAILSKYASAWPSTPMEITYVAPFPDAAGQNDGKTVKDWFLAAYPGRAGTMVSSVFANAQAGAPVKVTFPHSGQQFQQCFGNADPACLYQKGTTVPSPLPEFNDIFVDMVDNALANGMACLELYQADAANVRVATLAAQSARLKANA